MIFLNRIKIEPTIFPDKTSQVWKINLPPANDVIIEWDFESESELIHVAQLNDLLKKEGYKTRLYMPYLPYGRQDKEISNSSTFALLSFSKLINTMGFEEISCQDAHSNVAENLINNFYSYSPYQPIRLAIASSNADILCFPDNGANADKELIGGSVPATEHSVMCLGGKETEYETYERLITEVYPNGIISIVSDTWDFWYTLDHTVRGLKDKILVRDGKVVIRPDSGDPTKILCGDLDAKPGSNEHKGAVQILWEIFGGKTNSKGYRELDSHIGLIYGDSITLDKCFEICEILEKKGFASTNVVFGIGSYTYQYVTRDTFGFAMKATYGIIDGNPVEIYKDPLTDGGVKKSAKGLLRVNADLTLSECVSEKEENEGLLELVFVDGKLIKKTTLANIRLRIKEELSYYDTV